MTVRRWIAIRKALLAACRHFRGRSAVPFTPSSSSRSVASIALDPTLTGGIGSNDSSGDKGLLVVVQPRDAQGRTVDAPAVMNVAVFDPAFEGDAARLARWDFTAAETAALFRRTDAGAAIHLAMAWPEESAET